MIKPPHLHEIAVRNLPKRPLYLRTSLTRVCFCKVAARSYLRQPAFLAEPAEDLPDLGKSLITHKL